MDNGILCFVARMIIEEKIDGGTFIDLPCDQGKLREELKLTRGGANKIAKLLLSEEVQSHTPGSDHKEEKGEWMGRGPYKLIDTC